MGGIQRRQVEAEFEVDGVPDEMSLVTILQHLLKASFQLPLGTLIHVGSHENLT